MPDEDNKKLNPQIAKATIGRRNLREIEIYPLAVGDQLSMTSIIGETISLFTEGIDEAEAIGIGVGLIQNNIPMILSFVVDTDKETVENLLKEITNEQAIIISEIVYEQNYKSLIKKVRGLLEKVREEMKESPSRRPLQPSVNTMDTDLETSIGSDLKTVASQ